MMSNLGEIMKEIEENNIKIEDSQDNEHYLIDLPLEVVESLDIENEDPVTLIVENQKIAVHLKKNSEIINGKAILLRSFLIPALIASLIFIMYCYFNKQFQIALSGDESIATAVIILGLISGMITFTYYFIKERRTQAGTTTKDIYWRNFPTVVLSFAVIALFVLIIFFKILNELFLGVSFDLFTSTFLFFLFVSIINYSMIYMALSITPSLLTNVLFFVIIGGIFASMITNSDRQWWIYNFSFLGTDDAKNSWRFNITLIFSGLLMIALIDYLFVILKRNLANHKRLLVLRILLILTALCLAAVGAFPYNSDPFFQQVHNSVAGYLVYLIIILIVGLRWLLPEISKEFLRLSYIILTALVATVFLFKGINYLSLTAFELLAFLLAFAWLLLLLHNLQLLAHQSSKVFESKIKVIDLDEK